MGSECEPGIEEYKDVKYTDVKDKIHVAESEFSYGLMSVNDGQFTLDVDDPSQDEKDAVGTTKAAVQTFFKKEAEGNGAESDRQKAIRHIYHEANHPLGSLWDWARRGNTKKGRYRRWRSLQYWATGTMNNPPPDIADKPEKKAEWRARWNGNRKIYKRMKERVKEHIDDNKDDTSGQGNIVTFDGKPCPSWIASRLQAKRNSGAWGGILVSGYRTKEYSQQLCYNMCGAPSCPGRCAGLASNHACPPSFAGIMYEGACDLSLYWQFPEGDHLINNLPNDLVHFSNSGY